MNSLSFVKLLLCAQSLWLTRRLGRELGRVALLTVQRQHEWSREGFPQYSLCPYGGIRLISLMSSTRQGNGSSSWTVREKRGGPGITVKQEKQTEKKNQYESGTGNTSDASSGTASGWYAMVC